MNLPTSLNFKSSPAFMMTLQCVELGKDSGSNRAIVIVMDKFAASTKQLSNISVISGQLL